MSFISQKKTYRLFSQPSICPWLLVSLGFCLVPYFWESLLTFLLPYCLCLFFCATHATGEDSKGSGKPSPVESEISDSVLPPGHLCGCLPPAVRCQPCAVSCSESDGVIYCEMVTLAREIHQRRLSTWPSSGTRHFISCSYLWQNICGKGKCGRLHRMTLRSPLHDSLKYKILPQILTNESSILWLDTF